MRSKDFCSNILDVKEDSCSNIFSNILNAKEDLCSPFWVRSKTFVCGCEGGLLFTVLGAKQDFCSNILDAMEAFVCHFGCKQDYC